MSIFNPEKWAKDHFQHANLGDSRRTERLVNTCANMAGSSGKSIARACHCHEAQLEGAYRLIRNQHVSPEMIRVAGSSIRPPWLKMSLKFWISKIPPL
jgi:hypothetical protein